jgi:hypothetical protein
VLSSIKIIGALGFGVGVGVGVGVGIGVGVGAGVGVGVGVVLEAASQKPPVTENRPLLEVEVVPATA